ncbi:MAG: hypothetical protein ACOX6V_00905 [Patescibacteria group bacterium]|jgi:hypothetical protein
MRIYFTAAISAASQYGDNYRQIVKHLKDMGHTVVAEHILDVKLNIILEESQKESVRYYKRMQQELAKADLLVAEVSFPSTVHVGHELTLALENEKPVLALHVKGRRPVLLWGNSSEKFYVEEYDLQNLKRVLEYSIDYLSEQKDVRFNFFVSPRIADFLNSVSKKRKMPRAVYLRRLIEKDMVANKEYDQKS